MNSQKHFIISLFLLAFGACSTEKDAFHKRLMFDVKKGYHVYVVVPVNLNNFKTEVCFTDAQLRYLTMQGGQELPPRVFLSLLKKALNKKYTYTIIDTTGEVIHYTANDSIYNYLDSMGLQNVIKKHIDPEFQRINWDSVPTDEVRYNLIRYLYYQNYKVTYGDFSGSSFIFPPPHKLPTRAMQRLRDAPFRKYKK